MKKIMMTAAVAATMAMAGGNTDTVVAPVAKNFYAGGAITAVQTYINGESNWFDDTISAETGGGLQLQAGYVFYRNDAFTASVEARIADTFFNYDLGQDGSLLTYSALIKPQYNFNDIGVYGLVGFGVSDFSEDNFSENESGFVWGLGANYAFSDTIEVFADYTVNPTFETQGYRDVENDVMAFGVNYKF